MIFDDCLYIGGIMGVILFLVFLVCLPFILTIVLGVHFANVLNLTGITWWAFVIIFYIIIMGIIGKVM